MSAKLERSRAPAHRGIYLCMCHVNTSTVLSRTFIKVHLRRCAQIACWCTATDEARCMHAEFASTWKKISDVQTLLVFAAQQGPTGSSNTVGLN
jgi:hypothetical protein